VKKTVVGVITLTIVLAAASTAGAQSTTTPPTTAPAAPGAGAVRGVTPTTIKVGGVGQSFLYGGANIGARARFQRANASGGVNGRTIDYIGFTDDGGVGATGTTAAQKLVEQDGVFAVVPVVTPDFAASSYLVKQHVPYFGWALSSNFCGNRDGFGFTGCPVPEDATSNAWPLLISKMFPTGSTSGAVAIVAEDTPSGNYEVATLSAAAKSVKLRVAYAKTSLATPATADYNAIAREVVTSNGGSIPNAVFVVGGPSNVYGMQQALSANGYLGLFTNRIGYAPNLVAPAASTVVFTQTAPTESASTNAAMQQLVDDVHRIAPDQPIDQGVIAGYWSADLFLAALQKAGKNLTPATLVSAANRKFTYEVPNTVGPTTFPAAHAVPTPCGALVASDGSTYSVKVPYTCGRVVRVK
jgi:ABC-type branched-subunit amino acid transport system substrate-binding protein